MFRVIQTSRLESSDSTASYSVMLDKEYIVGEFIDAVLSNDKEWGTIGIHKRGTVFGDPKCEYKYGALLNTLPDDILNKKVVSATGDGGWYMMNYILKVRRR